MDLTNPLRGIFSDPGERWAYFNAMSAAFAQLCTASACVMAPDTSNKGANLNKDGIWYKTEYQTLKRTDNAQQPPVGNVSVLPPVPPPHPCDDLGELLLLTASKICMINQDTQLISPDQYYIRSWEPNPSNKARSIGPEPTSASTIERRKEKDAIEKYGATKLTEWFNDIPF